MSDEERKGIEFSGWPNGVIRKRYVQINSISLKDEPGKKRGLVQVHFCILRPLNSILPPLSIGE